MPKEKVVPPNVILEDVLVEQIIIEEIVELTENLAPEIGDYEWTEYVLGLMHPSELVNGKPRVVGLERVARKLKDKIGILITDVSKIVESNLAQSAVSVEHTIVALLNGQPYTFSGLADSTVPNAGKMFSKFATAMAQTRARGRAYRALLCLAVVTAEEISGSKSDSNTPDISEDSDNFFDQQVVSTRQLASLDGIFKRRNINALKFFDANGIVNFKEMDKNKAIGLLSKANVLDKDGANIPEDMLGYKTNWSK